MKKRILSGLLALVCALTMIVPASAEEPAHSFGYDFDAMTIGVPIDVIVPASITAYLNPYGATVAFDRKTLKRDNNATGDDRLELTGDIISPAYAIENVGEMPIRVYAGVSGSGIGKAELVDPSNDVSEWNGSQQSFGVNLWVTGGISEEVVNTASYSVANSIAITETKTTRTLIEYLGGSSTGYFKINGRLNKYAKGWGDGDGVHISLALKLVPVGS